MNQVKLSRKSAQLSYSVIEQAKLSGNPLC
jgi:hypothetical protein